MEQHDINLKINEVSKSILSYCMSRTSNQQDAEDLAQDIIVELVKSLPTIRDEQAFYKFMWTVARNIYNGWYKKKLKSPQCELTPETHVYYEQFHMIDADAETLYLLRRELSLMSEKYRKVTILYYLENKSCSDIAQQLVISEDMVKYLLFKARKSLKEGMNMNRNYGEQSYNPKALNLLYMGEGPNQFWNILLNKLIPQNILWACYNDELTGEDISLQIGVALPYLEYELQILLEAGLLLKKGNKYTTNIIILSNEFHKEASSKVSIFQEQLAETINNFLMSNEETIKNIGFYGASMNHNIYMWQMMCMTYSLALNKFHDKYFPNELPITAFGDRAYVCGAEECHSSFNTCQMQGTPAGLPEGCTLSFLDWSPNPKGTHHDFYSDRKLATLLIRLAKGEIPSPNVYEQEMLVTLIQKGYVINNAGDLKVTLPIYTQTQHAQIVGVLAPLVDAIAPLIEQIFEINCQVLKSHSASHLKKCVPGIASMALFEYITAGPSHIMISKNYLSTDWVTPELPTTYMIIN